MALADIITEKLTEAFRPEQLKVVDESYKHQGHAGARPGGETHFRVVVVATSFNGVSKIKRHQQVYKTLEKEMREQIHALALQTLTPEEWKKNNA